MIDQRDQMTDVHSTRNQLTQLVSLGSDYVAVSIETYLSYLIVPRIDSILACLLIGVCSKDLKLLTELHISLDLKQALAHARIQIKP